MILVRPKILISSRSLSPVIRCVALPSFARARRKSSFASRQIAIVLTTSINSPTSLKRRIKFSRSIFVKYFLNLSHCATSINSLINVSLKINVISLSDNILSSFEKSLIKRKLIHRLVSIITLSFLFGITFCSNYFYLPCNFF